MDGHVLSQPPSAQPNPSPHQRLLSPRAAALTVLVLLAVALGVTRLLLGAPGEKAVRTSATRTAPPSTLAPAQVTELHKALHDLDTACSKGRTDTTQQAVARDTQVIVEFAKRYPNAVFPIDDETGRTLSLLIVTRQTLRRCAPQLVAPVDALLPSDLRSAGAPRRGTP